MTTKERIIQKFEQRFIIRNWEADAHAEDVHIADKPDDIKDFISQALAQVIEETRRQTLFELGRWVRGVNFQGGDINRDMFTAELDRLQTLIDEK